jgi:hypothetical protein
MGLPYPLGHKLELLRMSKGRFITRIDGNEIVTAGVSIEFDPGRADGTAVIRLRLSEPMIVRDATDEEISKRITKPSNGP